MTLERSFFFLLTAESFVCKTWRMIWLQLHGSKARTNQLVSSCGSVDEPHVPLGAAESWLASLCWYVCMHSPHPVHSGQCALVSGRWHGALRARFSPLGEQKGNAGRWGASRELVPAGTGPAAAAPRQLWLQVAVITSQRFSCVRDNELLLRRCLPGPAGRKQRPYWKRGAGDRHWVVEVPSRL